jgi:uncharacterized protein YraI
MSLPRTFWVGALLLLSTAAVASPRTAVLDNNLNLRAGPGLDKRVVVVMPAGASVTVGECRGEWCAVAYRNHRGFVSSALVKGGDSAYAAAPVTAPAPAAPQPSTKYDADDGVRVLNWHDREWRDRYWQDRSR